ncbi:MAG: septation regulator SpoVG [Negativibacillus massiliensis]|uniref:septation regulator SpoVG n=1 Tax=Negativibacillus massiliensis TaxID=1871035 RepID=UPI0023F49E0E|nr:septation regulator SpoVG [Negativibacillus massiliensis]MCI6349111.1 septation regulator SpoVG [Negativibacillus massiliensis]MDY4048352.1 septation regulator SpoVG [Negativibacillus massiliensis]
MNITDIRIRKTYSDNRLRALVSITVDYDLAVHDIKIIEGPERLFVAMPSRKDENGTFRDISHPITPQARKQLEDAVLQAYQQYITQQQEVGDDSTPDSFSDSSPAAKQPSRQTTLWEQNLYHNPNITFHA